MRIEVCGASADYKVVTDFMLGQLASGKNIVVLYGDLGAGKTTLVKILASSLGGDSNSVDSPTFSIVNEYSFQDKKVYHFDLYRLETPAEIEDIGFWEYLDSGNLCIIEWPHKIADFLPSEQVLSVEISLPSSLCREYYFY